LDAAARWITEPQAEAAILSHHGEYPHVGDGLNLSVAPSGYLGARRVDNATSAVLVFVSSPIKLDEAVPEPLTAREFAALRADVEARFTILESWNGIAGTSEDTVSYLVGGVNPGLSEAVSRYHDGFPAHGSVFCGCDGCDWLADGVDAVLPPAWVCVPRTEGGGGRADDGSNLETIRRALARLAPVCADLGIQTSLLAAGLRGHIVGEPRAVAFQPDEGHGILMAAETTKALVSAMVELNPLRKGLGL
jgi:hypothetical protein